MSANTARRVRTLSNNNTVGRALVRSPSPPTQTFHPSILPHTIPTPALVESVAGGAHYSGVRVDQDGVLKQRRNSQVQYKHTEIKSNHKSILDDLLQLYSLKPSLDILERSWSRSAQFDDPLYRSRGFSEYAAHWFMMPKIYTASKTISYRVMSSTSSPNRLVFFLTQEYTMRLFNRTKMVESIVVVDLNEEDKIIRLVDQWSGKQLPSWFGSSCLRSMNSRFLSWFVHVPKARHGLAS